MPKVSVCVPTHNMENGDYFLARLEHSLAIQTFKDWELVITSAGKMAENSNAAIKEAKGEIIKMLYMDDYLAHEHSLQRLVDNFNGGWFASGCTHTMDGKEMFNPHLPTWGPHIYEGTNTIGSPSVVAFENNDPPLFDEKMSWMLDVDLYTRLYEKYGLPTLWNEIDVVIGIGQHQTTHKMSRPEKREEEDYFFYKHHLV